jgi:hypothetical protein
MVILINFSQNPFKIEYRDGSKALVKAIPSNKIVAMKGLRNSEQITNRTELARQGVTIYNYERGTYFHNNGRSYSSFPFVFIGNDVKQSTIDNTTLGLSGSTTLSAATFSKGNMPSVTTYTYTLTANTAGTAGLITATTVGNNIYISFKSPTTSAQLITGLTASASYVALGVTTTGGNGTGISASTFSLVTSTQLPASSFYRNLQSRV